MTYDEYKALPKKTRIKRMQSITKKMNNNHKERMYVPYVGQRVRSYVITHNDNKCIEQHCVVEDISASDSPIKVGSNGNWKRCKASMRKELLKTAWSNSPSHLNRSLRSSKQKRLPSARLGRNLKSKYP